MCVVGLEQYYHITMGNGESTSRRICMQKSDEGTIQVKFCYFVTLIKARAFWAPLFGFDFYIYLIKSLKIVREYVCNCKNCIKKHII